MLIQAREGQRKGQKAADTAQKRLYSVKEASLYLGVSAWTVRERIGSGVLPVVRLGRRTLVDLRDLDRLIEVNKSRAEL